MNKIIIVHEVYDEAKDEIHVHNDLCQFLIEYFANERPENLQIYYQSIAESNNVTPRTKQDIDYLQSLSGTFYVVVYPAIAWPIVFAIVAAVMAAYSIYMIATMPKPQQNSIGSSNNELSNRSNKARVKSRIPDIFGQVRSYPDLIASTYTVYENGIEIEECLMCIGRGHYKVHDCRDGDTDVNGIDGVSVSIYNPDTNICGAETVYKTGKAFTALPLATRKSDSINGQSLEKPNDLSLSSKALYFESAGVIKSTESVDFRKYFKVGDGIAITGAKYRVKDINLSGDATVTPDFKIIVQSSAQLEDLALYQGVLLSGATFDYVTTETQRDPKTGKETSTTQTVVKDVSGQYDVSAIQQEKSGNSFIITIQLSSPKQVNYNWNYVLENKSLKAGVILNKNVNSIDLDDEYSVSAISETQINLANASTVNEDWVKIQNLPNGSTLGQLTDVDLDVVANKWVGWFSLYFEKATHLTFNVYAPNGMYATTDSGKERKAGCTITIEYQMLDLDGNPIGEIYTKKWSIWAQTKDSFGRTAKYALPVPSNVRFRLAKTYAKSNNRPVTEVKIKDVYASYALNKSTYPGVTVVRSKTVATDGALSLKERKLNCLVTRKLKLDGVGDLVATKDAGQALINLALDEHVGRRSMTELDIEQIKSEIEKIKTYFKSDVAAEFSYTFDDDGLSFEEQASMIASACFCETTRFGNRLRLKFEKPQDNSVLLFNHRNKVPGSEKRTYKFGIEKDYDGIELEYTSPDDDVRVTYKIPIDGSAKNPQKISTTGIRNHAVAKTRAWREWNRLLYAHTSCEFDGLDESELLQRNDRILVADNTQVDTQDGEVIKVNGLTVALSQNVEFAENTMYHCYFQLSDGSVDMIACLPGEMTNEIILTRPPLRPLVVDADRYVKTLYTIVKASDVDQQVFMLTELSPNDQMTNRLTCINYDDRYYQDDHTFI